jgi:HAD superfamily hydrolase (TIGR01484 family)
LLRHKYFMSLPIKLISTDFDGTLFEEFENPPIPQRLVELIGNLQARGAKWIINTGRDMSSLMEALARSRIKIQPDFLVLVEREIYQHDGVRYSAVPDWNTACNNDHAALFEQVRPEVASLVDWVNSRFRAAVYEDPYSPFCVIAGNNGEADLIHTRMNEFCAQFSRLTVVRNDVYARFSHVAYNKGTALAEISRQLAVTPAEILAAGDHWNDLPMLKSEYARLLVAPQNAVLEVKEAVGRQQGFISQLNCGHGVADGLEYHLSTTK